MDGLTRTAQQLASLWRSLATPQRLAVGCLALGVAVAVGWGVASRGQQDQWVRLGQGLTESDRQEAEAAFEAAGLKGYRFDGSRLQVLAGQAERYVVVLRQLTTAPGAKIEGSGRDGENDLGQLGLFPTSAEYERARERALRIRIRQMLLEVSEIKDARVFLARSQQRAPFSRRGSRVTATISVLPRNGSPLTQPLIERLKTAIAHAVPDLVADDVVIFEQANAKTVTAAATTAQVARGQSPADTGLTNGSAANVDPKVLAWWVGGGLVVLLLLVFAVRERTRGRQEEPAENLDLAGSADPDPDPDPDADAETGDKEDAAATNAPEPGGPAADPSINRDHPLEFLVEVDSELLAGWLAEEHPQAAAVVVSQLEELQAAEVLDCLPASLGREIQRRLEDVREPHPDVLEDLADTLRDRWRDEEAGVEHGEAGVVSAVTAEGGVGKHGWSEREVRLLQAVDGVLNEFEDVVEMADLQVRSLFDQAGPHSWSLALAGASYEVRQTILRVLDPADAQRLAMDLDTLGPVRLADIERAQRDLLKQARRLVGATSKPAKRGGENRE